MWRDVKAANLEKKYIWRIPPHWHHWQEVAARRCRWGTVWSIMAVEREMRGRSALSPLSNIPLNLLSQANNPFQMSTHLLQPSHNPLILHRCRQKCEDRNVHCQKQSNVMNEKSELHWLLENWTKLDWESTAVTDSVEKFALVIHCSLSPFFLSQWLKYQLYLHRDCGYFVRTQERQKKKIKRYFSL